MPEIIVYTNDQSCANGVAEINPFTVGDPTSWTLKFNNGTDFFDVTDVTMSVGHVNGLPQGTYNDAFKWTDRADNVSIADIVISASGVPSLTFNAGTSPKGGVIGDNGVYILRGPQLDGSVASATIEYSGRFLDFPGSSTQVVQVGNDEGGTPAILQIGISAPAPTVQTYTAAGTNYNIWMQGTVSSVSILEAGSGFSSNQSTLGNVQLSRKFIQVIPISAGGGTTYRTIFQEGAPPVVVLHVNAPQYEFPFMRDETDNDIIAATTLSPYSDGDIEGSTQFNHSSLVIRPETVANASSLTPSGSGSTAKWTATMDPINPYVTERLALRNSTQLDIQIRGNDGSGVRTLFQGQLTILNKIA